MTHYLLAVFTTSRPCELKLSEILDPYEERASNPFSKWDWWMIGGRWHGELIVKKGVNDFILGEPGIGRPPAFLGQADGARMKDIDWNGMIESNQQQRAFHWDQTPTTALLPHAFIHNGHWHEQGHMGWFCDVQDEKPRVSWQTEFEQALSALPKEHWITLVDCHI